MKKSQTNIISQQTSIENQTDDTHNNAIYQDYSSTTSSVEQKSSDYIINNTCCNRTIDLTIITEFFPPDYAATGQLIEELVQHLEKEGVLINIFTGQPGYAFTTTQAPALEKIGDIRIQRSRSTQVWTGRIRGKAINGVLFTLRSFLHIIKNFRSNKVFLLTSAPPFLPIAGYLANFVLRFPYVCLIYDLYPDIAIALGVVSKNHWLSKFWRQLNRHIWQKAKGVIVLSPAMKEQVIVTCPEVADKISVIHSWGDPDQIKPMSKEDNWFAKKYNLVEKFIVLYSGNMGRCHDVDTILETAKQLQNEEIQFVCIGGGQKREKLIQDVNELGLKNFLFLPYQDKKILPYSLTACDLALVSVDSGLENLVAPSKLYPALAAQRPIVAICAQQSYLRNLIKEGEFGLAVDNGDSIGLKDAILQIKNNPQLAENMGIASRKYLQSNFTPQIIAKEYLECLKRCIA